MRRNTALPIVALPLIHLMALIWSYFVEIDDRTLLYKILYIGFLDIRIAAYEEKPYIGFFRIADFLHNLPSQLERAGRIKNDVEVYKNIMTDLRERARIKNCEPWLDHAIQNIKNNWKPIESESKRE